MHLKEGEQVQKIFYHHPTPFFYSVLKLILAVLPFFFMIFIFQDSMGVSLYIWANLVILLVFALLVTYKALLFWLDKLVVTNLRIIYIEWKFLTMRQESEAFLDDIQDIKTSEKGVLSSLWFFDYGDFILQTASSKITIVFDQAPDPEGIRRYIYHVRPQ